MSKRARLFAASLVLAIAAVFAWRLQATPPAAITSEPPQRPLSEYGQTSAGIPGAHNPDHFGVVVDDLDATLKWCTTVLGADLLWTAGPFRDPLNNPARYEVDGRAVSRVAMLRLGPNINFEVKEAPFPGQIKHFPRNADVGSPHIAFYVDDLQIASDYLQKHGAHLLAGPFKPGGAAKKGEEIRYFQAPFGMYMEIVHRPDHLPYEAQTAARLYGPAPSWKQDRPWAR